MVGEQTVPSPQSVPYNDAARVDEFIKYLEERPPYEAIGKLIVAAAELELNLIALALELGLEPKKAWYRDKRSRFLRDAGALSQQILDRIDLSTASRDLIAHGAWVNLFERGQAFLRPDREAGATSLRGQFVSADDLASWREELLDLNRVVENERRSISP